MLAEKGTRRQGAEGCLKQNPEGNSVTRRVRILECVFSVPLIDKAHSSPSRLKWIKHLAQNAFFRTRGIRQLWFKPRK